MRKFLLAGVGGQEVAMLQYRKPFVLPFADYFSLFKGIHQMAGVKGKSGGARANTGGARPGAGRPRNLRQLLDVSPCADPLSFLLAVMDDTRADIRQRIAAAKALMPYLHLKLAKAGLKELRTQDSHAAASGRFAPSAGPRLQVGRVIQMMPVNGRTKEFAG